MSCLLSWFPFIIVDQPIESRVGYFGLVLVEFVLLVVILVLGFVKRGQLAIPYTKHFVGDPVGESAKIGREPSPK